MKQTARKKSGNGRIDVTPLAAKIGLLGKVYFEPEVWAMCQPIASFRDKKLTQSVRDVYAQFILRYVHARVRRFRDNKLVFRPVSQRIPCDLMAVSMGEGAEPTMVIGLAQPMAIQLKLL